MRREEVNAKSDFFSLVLCARAQAYVFRMEPNADFFYGSIGSAMRGRM